MKIAGGEITTPGGSGTSWRMPWPALTGLTLGANVPLLPLLGDVTLQFASGLFGLGATYEGNV